MACGSRSKSASFVRVALSEKTIQGHIVDLTTQSVAEADGTTADRMELRECHNLEVFE